MSNASSPQFFESLCLPQEIARQIAAQIDAYPEEEICGLLAGNANVVSRCFAVPNVAIVKKVTFEMDSTALLRAVKEIDKAELTLLATYHSHPTGQLMLSSHDVMALGSQWPHIFHVVVSRKPDELMMKGWYFDEQDVVSVPIVIDDYGANPIRSQRLSNAQQVAIILAAVITIVVLVVLAVTLLPPPPDLTQQLR